MIRRRIVAVAATLAFCAGNVFAAEIGGVKLPDQVTLEGKTLKLNGAGIRAAKILFTFNVYAGGLYLETPGHDGDAIASSDQTKSIEMVFMRDTTAKQMADAIQEGFEKNCAANCAAFKPDVSKLQGMLKDMKKGETMAYHFLSNGVEVMIRGQKAGTIGDKAFGHQFIRCWIGKNPPNAELKEGLLGKK
jgi:hypothetical protein